jgi:hypothetical protein
VLNDAHYNELARLLLADIRALVPLVFPHNRPVSEAHIRLMAVTMQRWLVDGDLQKLLAPLRQSALFEVQGNSQAQAYAAKSNAFRYYLTAGVKANGRPVSHVYESPFSVTAVDKHFVREGRTRLTLKKFLAQPRLLHDGHWFNTGQILRFVANKLGGNHLDFDRSGQWARLDAANVFLRYGGPALAGPPEGSEIYLILEPHSGEVIGGVHLEVVAAAASFVQMEIGGKQLCTLKTETSLIGQLRKLFKSRPNIRMIDRPSN